MVKILKEGTKKITTCENCGCTFSYEKEDTRQVKVNTGSFVQNRVLVDCPQCSDPVILEQTK